MSINRYLVTTDVIIESIIEAESIGLAQLDAHQYMLDILGNGFGGEEAAKRLSKVYVEVCKPVKLDNQGEKCESCNCKP